MSAAKWEKRYDKQVQANNLLSDKLRETRKRGQQMIDTLKQAYSLKVTDVINLKYKVQTLEAALLAEKVDGGVK